MHEALYGRLERRKSKVISYLRYTIQPEEHPLASAPVGVL